MDETNRVKILGLESGEEERRAREQKEEEEKVMTSIEEAFFKKHILRVEKEAKKKWEK